MPPKARIHIKHMESSSGAKAPTTLSRYCEVHPKDEIKFICATYGKCLCPACKFVHSKDFPTHADAPPKCAAMHSMYEAEKVIDNNEKKLSETQ